MNSKLIFFLTILIPLIAILFILKNNKGVSCKLERDKKIIDFLNKNQKITNNDVEKLFKVSDSTATRYLENLEKAGEIVQIHKSGPYVYYELKK